jgi:hypothetical protein
MFTTRVVQLKEGVISIEPAPPVAGKDDQVQQLLRECWNLADRDGFEPPVPVVRSEAASSCQFQFLRHD